MRPRAALFWDVAAVGNVAVPSAGQCGVLGAAVRRNHENITKSSLGVGVAVILAGGDNSRPG